MTNNNKATFKDSSPARGKSSTRLLHALGVVIGLIAFILLMNIGWKHKNIPYLLAMGVYSLSFIWTYFTSTLYHMLHQAHTALRNCWHW
ncbi:MAG: hypothetical protein U5L96_05170 [Owenweeksia sp.]|nr:hypothetical protein [Owenweeksia sp.]